MRRGDGTSRAAGGGARGFTLVELIVALVLVAIFAALAVPSLSSTMQRADARQTAREIANKFRQARQAAMSRGEVVVAEVVTADGAPIASGVTSEAGHVALLRSQNNVTNCSATSGYDQVGEPMRVEEQSSTLQLHGTSGGSATQICFTPNGRALGESGAILDADTSGANCSLKNFRLWIAERTAGDTELEEARACDAEAATRTALNFWVVEVPYNGAIKAEK